MPLAVSTARVEITPQPGQPMAGYGTWDGPREATGTASPLWARAVCLWDDGYPNVIVSVDILGVGAQLNAGVRAALGGEVPDTDLMLLASHTHNGPALPDGLHPYISYNLTDTTVIDAYGVWQRDTVVQLVRDVLAGDRTPVTLDYRVASQSWSRNRAGLSYRETAVPVLTARGTDGDPVAVLYSYGCHPVAAGQQDEWYADYPGVASAVIEDAYPGAKALFIPGPAGDQNPPGPFSWSQAETLGQQLGNAVTAAAATPGRWISGPFRNSYREITLPLDITTTPSNMAAVRSLYVARQTAPGLYPWYARHGEVMVDQIDQGTYKTSIRVASQVWKLSGSPTLQIAMVGGELVSGYAVYFRNRYGGANGLIIGGYANGCTCYLPSNELLPPIKTGGSYEGGWKTDHPGIAGESMTVYGQIAHCKAGSAGTEAALISALNTQLA